MGFFSQILAYRRLAFVLIALTVGHLLVVGVAVYLVIRYLQLWAIPAVLWLPLSIVALRWTTARLKAFFSARDDYVSPSAITAEEPLPAHTREMLSNVAEEIAVATGDIEPRIAVCQSPGINAFISYPEEQGRNVMTVVFTSMMVKLLGRNELQGVVAHLYSHRRNIEHLFYSMTAAMYLTVFVVADLFLILNTLNWHFGGSGSFSTGPLVVVLSTGMMAGPILAASAMQHYIMRRMRFLDDLTALEITNDPESLVGALEKAADVDEKFEVSYDVSSAHFFFNSVTDPARKYPWQRLATHPTPAARVKALKAATSVGE